VAQLLWYLSACRRKYRLTVRRNTVTLIAPEMDNITVSSSSSSSSSGVAQDMTSCQRSIQAADKTGRPEGARNTARNVGLHLSRPPTLTHIASITQPCSVVPLSATTQWNRSRTGPAQRRNILSLYRPSHCQCALVELKSYTANEIKRNSGTPCHLCWCIFATTS